VSFFDEFSIRQMLQQLFQSHQAHDRVGSDRLSAIEHQLHFLKELLMALTPEVQALVEADAQLNAAVGNLTGKLDSLSAQAADLQAKLNAAPASGISAEDLEAIKAVTASISATVADAQAAVNPAPAVEAAPVAEEAPAVEVDASAADADAPAVDAADATEAVAAALASDDSAAPRNI
jgi:chromosome segregation ATPase